MIKTYQKIIDPNLGDCWKACLSSITEINYDDFPDVPSNSPNFKSIYSDFLKSKNLSINNYLWNPNLFSDCIKEYSFLNIPKTPQFFIGSVASPNYHDPNLSPYDNIMLGKSHAVVVDNSLNIIFDPNPLYSNIKNYPFSSIIKYNGIVNIEIIDILINN